MMYLLILFALFNILDGWTTYKAIKRGAAEANPVVKFLIDKLGLYWGLITAKVPIVVFIWVLAYFEQFSSIQGLCVLVAINVFYAAILFNNWKVLKGN